MMIIYSQAPLQSTSYVFQIMRFPKTVIFIGHLDHPTYQCVTSFCEGIKKSRSARRNLETLWKNNFFEKFWLMNQSFKIYNHLKFRVGVTRKNECRNKNLE